MTAGRSAPPRTPDGRYIVVRGRLRRASNPKLREAIRADLVAQLVDARRAVSRARREANADDERLVH